MNSQPKQNVCPICEKPVNGDFVPNAKVSHKDCIEPLMHKLNEERKKKNVERKTK